MINASFEFIEKVEKHPNADKLDILTISGYTVILEKNTYKVGDLVFFIREDSQIVINTKKFSWHEEVKTYLGKNGRVRTIKLRGVYSSGIVIPKEKIINDIMLNNLSTPVFFDNQDKELDINYIELNKMLEDEKILEEYCGIKHYVSPIIGTSFGNTLIRGELPFDLNKTDEENWQNLENLPFGEKVLLTKKKDGTSCTLCFIKDDYHVCSRNYNLDVYTDNIYNNTTKELVNSIINRSVLDCIDDDEVLIIRGEICGKGIQSKQINKDC